MVRPRPYRFSWEEWPRCWAYLHQTYTRVASTLASAMDVQSSYEVSVLLLFGSLGMVTPKLIWGKLREAFIFTWSWWRTKVFWSLHYCNFVPSAFAWIGAVGPVYMPLLIGANTNSITLFLTIYHTLVDGWSWMEGRDRQKEPSTWHGECSSWMLIGWTWYWLD